MFESWIGPDRFRKGIGHYLDKHTFGNATSADFLSAIGEGAGRANVAPASLSTFLEQPGVLLVGGVATAAAARPTSRSTHRRSATCLRGSSWAPRPRAGIFRSPCASAKGTRPRGARRPC